MISLPSSASIDCSFYHVDFPILVFISCEMFIFPIPIVVFFSKCSWFFQMILNQTFAIWSTLWHYIVAPVPPGLVGRRHSVLAVALYGVTCDSNPRGEFVETSVVPSKSGNGESPKHAATHTGCLISWKIPNLTWMITGGTPILGQKITK